MLTACGGELTGEGVIRSPFFPNVYPGERTCRWTIHQPQSQVILLNFTVFETGSSAHCETDYVEVRGKKSLNLYLVVYYKKYYGLLSSNLLEEMKAVYVDQYVLWIHM